MYGEDSSFGVVTGKSRLLDSMKRTMKRIFLLFCLAVICQLTVWAQLSGGFYNQNGCVYFVGQNVSGYALGNLTVRCVNFVLNQRQFYSVESLANGGSFSIGPENGWQWQPGEQVIVTYQSGLSVYWTFQPASAYGVPYSNPSSAESSSHNLVIQERIRQLEWKIRDAERSLRKYEEWNRKNPSISSSQLVNSQRRLIRTYQEQIQELMRQLY